jgi:AraC-like DNA-binding protein
MKDYSNYFYKKMPDENFFVDIFKNEHHNPGPAFGIHWHEHIQFFYFTKGEASLICNSKKINVKAHDIIIINSNELHYIENLCDNLAYYVIRVDLSFLFSNQVDSCQTKFMAPLSQNLILFKNLVRNDKNILNCVNKIIKEYFNKEIGFELAVKSYIYELIVLLIRGYIKKIFTEEEFNSQVNNLRRFNVILKYIENNFTQRTTISELAAMANVSNYHFCRLFKQITGKSAVDYINKLRIDKAVCLLCENDLNITEIALACGFNDSNYFSRLFKKHKNISPAEFRKNLI